METKNTKLSHEEYRATYLTCAVELMAQHPCVPFSLETREAVEAWVKGELAKVLRDADAFAKRKVAE